MAADPISVVKVGDVLMVTMPPDPDDGVIQALQQRALDAMQRYYARGLVLDITAVETLDSFFARTLTETAQMVALMGGRTIIAGMRPSVAITITQLGLTIGNVLTALNTERALALLSNLPPQRPPR
jgi:rsbT antagonist protein RsbS